MRLSVIEPSKLDPHLQLLATLFLVLQQICREGLMSIESDIDQPRKSESFTSIAPFDEANAAIYTVVCDALRLMVGGNLDLGDMTRYLTAARKTAGLAAEQHSLFDVLELTLLSVLNGAAPQVAVEFGRHGVPASVKPGFTEFEDFLRKKSTLMTRAETDKALETFFAGLGES